MTRKPYSSDLTNAQWRKIQPLLPKALPGGHPREVNIREVLNAIYYREKHGCTWQDLPHDFPPSGTVYWYYQQWTQDGTWERVHQFLVAKTRRLMGKRAQPTAAIIDSQSVKTAEKGGLEATTLVKE